MKTTTTLQSRLTIALMGLVIATLATGCAVSPQSEAYTINESMKGHRVNDKASNAEHQQASPVLKHSALVAGSALGPQGGLLSLSFESLAASMVTALLDINTTKSYEMTWIVGRAPMTDGQSGKEMNAAIFTSYAEAVEASLADQGWAYQMYELDEPVHRGADVDLDDVYETRVYIIHAPEYGCEYSATSDGVKDSTCSVLVRAGGLETENSSNGQKVWRMDRGMGHKIKFYTTNEAQLPTVDLHAKISEKLPEWAFMFIPDSPNYLMVSSEGKAKGYPYFLNQGEELHFITPKGPATK